MRTRSTTLLALCACAAAARATAGDDGRKNDVESRLLEILRSRQVINEEEFHDLTELSVRLRAAEAQPAILPQGEPAPAGPTFKAEPGKGVTFTAANFRLNIKNTMMLRWSYSDFDAAPDVNTFAVARPRTAFTGSVFDPDLTFNLTGQWDEGTALKNAWVNYDFIKPDENTRVGVRVGQQKTLFGRIATATSYGQEFVDRDIATTTFANSRSRGVLVHGHHGKGLVHWHGGVFNSDTAAGFPGAGEERGNPDNELDFTAGIRFDPMGDLGDESYTSGDLDRGEELRASFGAAVWVGNENLGNTAAGRDVEVLDLNLNAALKVKGFHALGEVFLRDDELQAAGALPAAEISAMGWNVQGSYTFEPDAKGQQWGVGGRYTMVTLDDNIPAAFTGYAFPGLGTTMGDVTDLTIGVSNYYRKHALKTQIDFTFRTTEPDAPGATDTDDYLIRVQFAIQI
jgi:hypothetical protein